ncbi:hypothetical protein EYF80_068284 [Liparis tanakae]|uniref:Uncharacterized protein n=1 Tax=Liparis tanakae TaxID=230148 RepID=A0A4Z2DYI9_9TELE|nr:hypothetical protein EYF80_068284 [Liparis tanakae]
MWVQPEGGRGPAHPQEDDGGEIDRSKVPRGSPDSGLKETIDHRSRHRDAGLSTSRPQEEEPRRRGIAFPATATGWPGEAVSSWRRGPDTGYPTGGLFTAAAT